MRKKFLAILLAVCMIVSMIPATAGAATFDDTEGHWSSESVSRWTEAGVLNGDGTGKFLPDKEMTRAEFAQMLCNLMGYTEKAENAFTDVSDSDWFADAILKLVAAGVMSGVGDNKAAPNDPITREQAAVLLCRALNIKPTANASVDFNDAASVSAWAKDAVAALTERGMINGVGDNTFAPALNINRASVATMVDNMVAEYVTKDTTITGEVKGVVIVKSGNVTVEDATLAEPVVVAPAATNATVNLAGTTKAADVVVAAEGAKVVVAETATAASVTVEAPKAEAHVAGKVETVAVAETAEGAKATVAATAEVKDVTVEAPKAETQVAGKAENVTVAESAEGAKALVAEGAEVTGVTVAAPNAEAQVAGKVETVAVAETAQGAKATVGETAEVTGVTVAAPNAETHVAGKVESVAVAETAEGAKAVVATTAEVKDVAVAAPNAETSISGTVTNVAVAETATGASVAATEGAKVESVTTSAENVTVNAAKDTVTNVTASAGSADIKASGAEVKNDGADKVTVDGDKEVASGDKTTSTVVGETPAPVEPDKIDTSIGETTPDTPAPAPDTTPSPAPSPSNKPSGGSSSGGSSSGGSSGGSDPEPSESTKPEHNLTYTPNETAGTHKVTCSVEGCTEGHNVEAEDCVDSNSDNKCDKCGADMPSSEPEQPTEKKYKVVIKTSTGGTVESDLKGNATNTKNTEVTLTVNVNGQTETSMPYVLKSLTVTAPGSKEATNIASGKTFTMDKEGTYTVNAEFEQPITEAAAFIANGGKNGGKHAADMIPFGYPEGDTDDTKLEANPFFFLGIKKAAGTPALTKDKITLTFNDRNVTVPGGWASFNKWVAAYVGDQAHTSDGHESPDKLNVTDDVGTFVLSFTYEGADYKFTVPYAKSGVPYTVTFNSNGGSTVNPKTVVSGSKIDEPSAPTKVGYTFGGWFKDAECTDDWAFASDTVTDNITLYAKWEAAAKHTVTFKGTTDTTVEVSEGGKVAESDFPAVDGKPGYTYSWVTSNGAAFTKDTVVNADIEVTIKWTNNAEFTAMTADVFKLYQDSAAFNEGMPKTLDAFGSATFAADTTNGTTINVTGTLKPITDKFIGFNTANETEQTGYYLLFQFEAPATAASATGPIVKTEKKDFTSSALDKVGEKQIFSFIWWVAAPSETEETASGKKTITIDWDGNGTMAETQYTLDFSGLTLQATTSTPAP